MMMMMVEARSRCQCLIALLQLHFMIEGKT